MLAVMWKQIKMKFRWIINNLYYIWYATWTKLIRKPAATYSYGEISNRFHQLLILYFPVCMQSHEPCVRSPLPYCSLHLDSFSFIEVSINFSCLCVSLFFIIGPCGSMLLCWVGDRLVRIESQWHTTKRGIKLWIGMGWNWWELFCMFVSVLLKTEFYLTLAPTSSLVFCVWLKA